MISYITVNKQIHYLNQVKVNLYVAQGRKHKTISRLKKFFKNFIFRRMKWKKDRGPSSSKTNLDPEQNSSPSRDLVAKIPETDSPFNEICESSSLSSTKLSRDLQADNRQSCGKSSDVIAGDDVTHEQSLTDSLRNDLMTKNS